MRYALRVSLFLVIATVVWIFSTTFHRPALAQQGEWQITLGVRVPVAPNSAATLRVIEGRAATIQWAEGDVSNHFALRPNRINGNAESVRVVIESPDGRLLDEVLTTVGAPATETKTTPPFRLQVLRVEQR